MKRISIACLVVLATACGLSTSPEAQPEVGIIVGIRSDDPQIAVPETVQAGESFAVMVTTYGLSGCWRMRTTKVEVEDLEATVTPFDVDLTEDRVACTAAIQDFVHTAALSFDRPGTAQVTIRGRELPGGRVVTFTSAVEVR